MLGCFLSLQITKSPLCTDPQWRQTRRLPSSLGTFLVARWAEVTHKSRCFMELFSQRFPSKVFHSCAGFHPSQSALLTPELLRTAVHTSWSEVSLWLVSWLTERCPCDECWPLRTTLRKVACVLYGPFCLANEVVDKHLSPEGQDNTPRQNRGY